MAQTSGAGRSMKNYYETLGVSEGASEDEIRGAYRRLAFEWHPDRNPAPAAADRFKEISEAYAVLINPAKRSEYDQVRSSGSSTGFRYDQEELFREMFSNPHSRMIFEELAREFERRGMRVDRHFFHQTLFGGRTTVTGGIFVISPLTPLIALFRFARAALAGVSPKGDLPGSAQRPSLKSWLGRIGRTLIGGAQAGPDQRGPQRTPMGRLDIVQTVHLTSQEAEQGGAMRVTVNRNKRSEQLLVTVPAGVSPGTKLRLQGKGLTGLGSSRGDLYLTVVIDN